MTQMDLFGRPDRPDLRAFDWILVNTSSGKDSQTTLRYVVRMCKEAGVDPKRIVAVHADLGRIEWPGCPQLAGRQAEHYGVRFEVVKRTGCDLLDRVRERGKWPGMGRTRYCTSDFKRSPIRRLMTALADEFHGGSFAGPGARFAGRECRILNCMGMRAQESPDRAKMRPFEMDHENSRRSVWNWLPIHPMPVEEVWSDIRKSGVPHHEVYDRGMPRLSCSFCIYAPPAALMLAGRLRPDLLCDYVEVEKATGHKFKIDVSIAAIQAAIAEGALTGPVSDWTM